MYAKKLPPIPHSSPLMVSAPTQRTNHQGGYALHTTNCAFGLLAWQGVKIVEVSAFNSDHRTLKVINFSKLLAMNAQNHKVRTYDSCNESVQILRVARYVFIS